MGALSYVLTLLSMLAVHGNDAYPDDVYQSYQSSSYQEYLDPLFSPDTKLCPRYMSFRDKYILDIKISQDHGAKLISAASAVNVADCAKMCCNDLSCDMSLFRTHGLSNSGHNCYMIKCGNPANCILAKHDEFVSLMFSGTQQDLTIGIGREHSPIDEETQDDDSEQQTDSYTTDSKRPTPVTHTVIQPVMTESRITQPTPVLAPPHLNTNPTNVPMNKTNGHSENQNNHHEMGNDLLTTTEQTGEVENATLLSVMPSATTISLPSVYHHDDNHIPERDPCDIHGCNGGSGVIVLAVVGGLAVIIVFFVGIIVTKRLYDNRQRKHFHNVDYLINGMYT